MKKIVFFISLIIFSLEGFSQVEIDSATVKKLQGYEFGGVYKSALSLNVGGVTGIAGITYDLLIAKKMGFEIGAGYLGGGIGFTYYPFGIEREKKKFHIVLKSSFTDLPWRPQLFMHSLSFGGTWFTINKFNIAADIGPGYAHTPASFTYYNPNPSTTHQIYLNLTFKISYRFSFKLMKRRWELNNKK
jgi:hypothetical protein